MFSSKVLVFLVVVATCMHCGNCLFGGDNFLFPFILGTLTCNGGLNFGGQGSTKCPEGWLKFKGHCYYFSKDELTWPEAQQTCASLGGALVQIDSEKENNFIVEEAKNQVEDADEDDWFIGANSLANKDKFYWEFTWKAVPLPGDKKFEDWADGKPEFNDKRCVVIDPEEGFQWDDDDCFDPELFICEKCPGCKRKATLECH